MRRSAMSAVVLGAMLLVAAPVHAKTRWVLRTIEVDNTYWMPPATHDGPCGADRPPGCVAIHGPTTIKGTLNTVGAYAGEVWPSTRYPGKLEYIGPNWFTGTIPGCGTGSWLHMDVNGVLDTDRPNLAEQSVRGRNTWVITGTGGQLEKRIVRGGGWQQFDSFPLRNGADDKWGEGAFGGEIVCRVPINKRGRRR